MKDARVWAEVDVSAFVENIERLRERLVPTANAVLVLKADAYGHGALELVPYARRAGIAAFALATVREALELRAAGVEDRLMVLGTTFFGELEDAIQADLELVVSTPALLNQLVSMGRELRVHLHFDTGMHRLGLDPAATETIASVLRSAPHLKVVGLMTHVASTRGALDARGREQVARFRAIAHTLKTERSLTSDVWFHAANSAGVLSGLAPELNAVRIGMAAFGLLPHPELAGTDLVPVLSLRARVAQTHRLAAGERVGYDGTWCAQRPSWIATVAAGYADGLSVRLSDRGSALVLGQRVPMIGRVSMDYVALDLTDLRGANVPPVSEGTPVTFLGREGNEEIDAWELGDLMGTGPYEVITSIGARVPRVLVNEFQRAEPRLAPTPAATESTR